MKVAIVGAPQTGKTQLADALLARLVAQNLTLDIVDAASVDRISSNDLVLLCGLDLGHPTPAQWQADLALRNALQEAALPFQVVYGKGSQRVDNAWFCLARQAPTVRPQFTRPEPPTRWSGPCETCGDGDCEHRLFTRLVNSSSVHCSDEGAGG